MFPRPTSAPSADHRARFLATRVTIRNASLLFSIGACIAAQCVYIFFAPPRPHRDRPASIPHLDHILTIVLENAEYSRAARAPFLHRLAQRGAVLTNYHAVAHPSYPNYLALVSGSTQSIHDNAPRLFDKGNLVDLLEQAHVSWKVYAENLPAPCSPVEVSPDGLYVRRHEPFASFRDIASDPVLCAHIVNAAEFPVDLSAYALPRYGLYIPNLDHDGHDTGLAAADAWLNAFLSPWLAQPSRLRNTLIIVTFGEGSRFWFNHVYTALIGDMVKPGVTNSQRYTHYSLLRLVEEGLDVGTLGKHDASTRPICCIWTSDQ